MDKILIIGHKNPDLDSLASCMLISNIFNQKGMSCSPAMFVDDVLSEEVQEIAIKFDLTNFTQIKKEEVDKYLYILVDHNDVQQSIENKNLVIGVIDHHKNVGWENDDRFIFKTCGATASLIYQHFNNSYNFSQKEKDLISITLAVDSSFGKSNKFNEQDMEIFEEISPKKTMEDYFLDFFKASDMSNSESILNSDKKIIRILGIDYASCSVSVKGNGTYKKFYEAIKNSPYDFEIGVFHDVKNNRTKYVLKEKNVINVGTYDKHISRETIINDIIREKEIELSSNSSIDKKELYSNIDFV